MAEITLFLSRSPKTEFTQIDEPRSTYNVDTTDTTDDERNRLYGRTSAWDPDHPSGYKRANGIWGTLGVMKGPKVLGARWSVSVAFDPDLQGAPDKYPLPGGIYATRYAAFNDRVIEYWTENAAPPIETVKDYTTSERYRDDHGQVDGGVGYIILQPRTSPYQLRTETGNKEVKKLRTGYNGNCIRILGTTRPKEDAILIHEAPAIGWVVGCIGPRPKGEQVVYDNVDGNPSHRSFLEIYNLLNSTSGGLASLIVLDWG